MIMRYLNIIMRFADNNSGDCMIKSKRNMIFFGIGAVGYGLIEILWRGYTHWAMLVAGGICFVIFSYIAEKFRSRPLILKAVLCALSVTTVEIIFGVVFNLILKENIWDYSSLPMNFMGQICLPYSFLWGILGFVFIPLADVLNEKIS